MGQQFSECYEIFKENVLPRLSCIEYSDKEELKREISTLEAYLPVDEEYSEFNRIISRSVTRLNEALERADLTEERVKSKFFSVGLALDMLFSEFDEDCPERAKAGVLKECEDLNDLTPPPNNFERVSESSSWGKIVQSYLE